MTPTASTRPRILTATRIYGAAIFSIGMAIPHFAIGLAGHWPGQLMSVHVLVIVLLLFAGRNAELAETRRPPTPALTGDEFDNITEQLRDLDH